MLGHGRRLPPEPNSSGSLRMAAAPMMGVARRNENRAASLFEAGKQPAAHCHPRTGEAGNQRQGLQPIRLPNALPQPSWCAIRASSSCSTCFDLRRSSSAPKSRRPFRVKKNAAERGDAKTWRSFARATGPGSRQGLCPGRAATRAWRPCRRDRCRGRAGFGRGLWRCEPSRPRRSRAGRAPSRDESRRGT